MIAVSHLTRRFGPLTAVDDVSFRLERGEVVGFLGINGAGKSTTMRMLTGFLPATRGAIEVAGFDVLRDAAAVRRRIGYLPEGVPLYREHRVEEMLRFQGRLHGLGRRELRARTDTVLDRVGLSDRRRALIGRLSKGQRQRVGLAVALLPDPEVLVLDEPTSGLDPLQRLEVRTLVSELAAERTVLLSSHILPEIEAVCPRVIVLHRGRLVADGTHEELARSLGGTAVLELRAKVADVEAAAAALGGLDEVLGLEREPVGNATLFRLRCSADCSEVVGELAARSGWIVLGLRFGGPSLEGLFARLATGADLEAELDPEVSASPSVETPAPSQPLGDRQA